MSSGPRGPAVHHDPLPLSRHGRVTFGGCFFFFPKTKPHTVDLSRGSKVGDEAEPEALELSDAQMRTVVLCKSKGAN